MKKMKATEPTYGRRAGDLAGADAQVIVEINTRGVGSYVVGFEHGTTLASIDDRIKRGRETGLIFKLDDERHIVMSAEMVRESVFIVRSGS